MPTQPPQSGPVSDNVSCLGVLGMIIAGIGVGLALALVTARLTIETDMSDMGIIGLIGLVTLSPAVALSLTRNRYWRGLAVGLIAVGVFLLLALMLNGGG
jgi:hypothetical protein